MRIRKNHMAARLSSSLEPFLRANHSTHVCEINRSPWDVQPLVMAFPQQELHLPRPIQNQASRQENSMARNGRERSDVVFDSLALLQATGYSVAEDKQDRKLEGVEDKEEISFARVCISGDSGMSVPHSPAGGKPKQSKQKTRVPRTTGKKKLAAKKPKKFWIAADGIISGKSCSVEDSDELRVCCKRKDGKRWQCSRAVTLGHSLCKHHLVQMRSYYPSGYRNINNPDNRDSGMIAGVGDWDGEKTSDSGKYYYYYTGFGPLWKKRRGKGSSICTTETTTATSHLCDEGDEDTDVGEGEKKKKDKKNKKKRKAMKARSLKSILQFSSVAISNETGRNAILEHKTCNCRDLER